MSGHKQFNRALFGLEVTYFLVVLAVSVAGVLPPLPGGLGLLAVLGLAAFRASRAVSFNLIGEPLRERLGIVTRPDSSGAGDNNHATGGGGLRAVAELVVCPICSGQWAAVLLIAVLAVPRFGDALVWSFAAAGVSEVLHWVSEYYEWGGRYSRERAGLHNRQAREELAFQAALQVEAYEREKRERAERAEKERVVSLVRNGNGNGGGHE